jgi:hypothetical protein
MSNVNEARREAERGDHVASCDIITQQPRTPRLSQLSGRPTPALRTSIRFIISSPPRARVTERSWNKSQSRSLLHIHPVRQASLVPFPMEDSPLSITSNIAGLLTFTVAIFGAIYVRYKSLRNGRMEMITIQESVIDTFDGLRMMRLRDQFVLKQDDEDVAVWSRKLEVSLFITDIIIFAYCNYAEGSSISYLQSSLRASPLAAFDSTMFDDATRELDRLIEKQNTRGTFSAILKNHFSFLSEYVSGFSTGSVATLFLFFYFLGTPRKLMRWYRVRERVLEKVREKETLQSRIVSCQIHMVNSQVWPTCLKLYPTNFFVVQSERVIKY